MRWIADLAALSALGAIACTPGKAALDCANRPSADLEPPESLRAFKLKKVDADRSRVADGFILLNQFGDHKESWASAIDGCGAHVWWQEQQAPETKITRTRMGLDGRSVIYSEYDRKRLVDTGEIRRVDLRTGDVSVTRAVEQHHDFVERPDGRLAWLSWQYTANVWLDRVSADLASDAILIADEGSDGDHDVVYSYLDDSGIEPFWSCDHMKPGRFVPGFAEWSHTNSLIYDADQDAYFALARYWDAVLRIDGDGTLRWILGGRLNEFDIIGKKSVLPEHGHMSEFWPGGMLVFDNRDHSEGLASRVAEYAIDEDARTVEETWSYEQPDGESWAYLGDVRRLPGGNVLIAWSGSGRITEVTRDGDIVWEAETDHEIGRLEFVPEFVAE